MGIQYTFCNYSQPYHYDWVDTDGVGIDAPAYLLTGVLSGGDYQRNKQIVYQTTHFEATEILVPPPVLTNSISGNWVYDMPITFQYDYTGGAAPFTFTTPTGTLPAGLTLSSGGAITGSPTAYATTNTFTTQLTDSSSDVVQQNESMYIWLPMAIEFTDTGGVLSFNILDSAYLSNVNVTPMQVFTTPPVYLMNAYSFCWYPISYQTWMGMLFIGGYTSGAVTTSFYELTNRGYQPNTARSVNWGSYTPNNQYYQSNYLDYNYNTNQFVWSNNGGEVVLFNWDGNILTYVSKNSYTTGGGSVTVKMSPSGNFAATLFNNVMPLHIVSLTSTAITPLTNTLPGMTSTSWPQYMSWIPSTTYPLQDVLCYTLVNVSASTTTTYVVQVNSNGTYTTLFSGTNVLGTFAELYNVRGFDLMSWYSNTLGYLCVKNATTNTNWLRSVSWNGTTLSVTGTDFNTGITTGNYVPMWVSSYASYNLFPSILLANGSVITVNSSGTPQSISAQSTNLQYRLMGHN